MASDASYPPAFVLAPVNKNAERAITDPKNHGLKLPLENGSWGLAVNFEFRREFSLGCASDCDIYLPQPRDAAVHIAKRQCAFKCRLDTGAVLLVDHSSLNSTEPSCGPHERCIPFADRPAKRSVLVALSINTFFAVGHNRHYQFQICWSYDGLRDFPDKSQPYTLGPELAAQRLYIQGVRIGSGSYGAVRSALDLFSGRLIAVKAFHDLEGKRLEFARREADNLVKINKSDIDHKHIIEIIGSAGGNPGDSFFEIMMPLKKGSVKTLVAADPNTDFSGTVLTQMLRALQCLARHKLIHRDIKPENILFEYDSHNRHHFRLGDFGLSHDLALARTVAGTEPFMAPEVFHRGPQTDRADIWSLFATVVWVRDTDGFRDECNYKGAVEIHRWLAALAEWAEFRNVRAMALIDAARRPSASALLKSLEKRSTIFCDPARPILPPHDPVEALGGLMQASHLDGPAENDADADDHYANPDNYQYDDTPRLDTFHHAGRVPYYESYPPPDQPRVDAFVSPLVPAYDAYDAYPYDPAYAQAESSASGTAVPNDFTMQHRQPEPPAADRKRKGKKTQK